MMYAQESTIDVQVGLLLRGTVRQMLERARFDGMHIRWLEDKRLLYSVFSIRGPASDVSHISERVQHWLRCAEATK